MSFIKRTINQFYHKLSFYELELYSHLKNLIATAAEITCPLQKTVFAHDFPPLYLSKMFKQIN